MWRAGQGQSWLGRPSSPGEEQAFWLLLITSEVIELKAPLQHGDQTYEAGDFVVRGRWLERCGTGSGPMAGAYDYWLREEAVVYSNLIFADAVEPLEEGGRQVGEYRVFSFDPLTEEVLEGQARAHAESCGVLGS